MKKFAKFVLLVYLIVSCAFSLAHAASCNPWEFREHRNGLLCAGILENAFVIYSPFCNHGDVFLFGVGYDERGFYTFSDGLYAFGEW